MAAGDRHAAEAEAALGEGRPRRRPPALSLGRAPATPPPTIRSTARRSIRGSSGPSAPRSPPSTRASALLPHPVAPLRIPFEGTTLPGYFLPAEGREAEARPLVIFTNGYDATVTEMYFACAVAASRARLPLPLLRRTGPGRDADRAGHADPPRLGDRHPPGRRFRADPAACRPRPDRALGLEPRRLSRAARRLRRAAARRLHRRPRPARGLDAARRSPGSALDLVDAATPGSVVERGARDAAEGEPADALGAGPARPLGPWRRRASASISRRRWR